MMKMKRMNQTHRLCMALLASCSGNEEPVAEPEHVTQLSFRVTVDQSGTPTSRAASWKYENTYEEGRTLDVVWDEKESYISVFHCHVGTTTPTTTPQWGSYQGTLNSTTEAGETLKVEINNPTLTWNNSDGIAVLFPHKDYPTTVEDGAHTVTISSPESFTQSGKNTTHLKDYMYMYGTLPCGTFSDADISTTMPLHHIPAVLCGWVGNTGSEPCIVKKVEAMASVGFPKTLTLTYTKDGDNLKVNLTPSTTDLIRTLPVTIKDGGTDTDWNKLAPGESFDTAGKLMAYAVCLPTATVQDYRFRVTATDADGNNEKVYISNAIPSTKLNTGGQLKSGYYYTFVLELNDDKLTANVAGAEISGWKPENGGQANAN